DTPDTSREQVVRLTDPGNLREVPGVPVHVHTRTEPPEARVTAEPATDFESFVAARSGALFGTAVLLTGDRHVAEDLLQTALSKSCLSWRGISGDPEAYVRRVLVNTYISMWRRKWNGETPTETLPETTSPAGSDRADRQDPVAAPHRLPKRQRAVVVLRYLEDLGEREVAVLLGCSVGTVKSQASRALAK